MEELALAVGFGLGSALLPVLNAEAYLLATCLSGASVGGWLTVAGLTIGQTAGKVAVYETARRGGRLLGRHAPPDADGDDLRPAGGPVRRRLASAAARVQGWLASPWGGGATVLVSAGVGVPPLAAVSVLAGVAHTRRAVFVVACLAGRGVRFLALAAPVLLLV